MQRTDLIDRMGQALNVSPQRLRQTFIGYAFISPGLIGIIVFLLGPMLYSLWLVLHEWDIVTPAEFVGLSNLRTMLFDDQFFWLSLWVTFKYTIVAVTIYDFCSRSGRFDLYE